MLPCASFMEPPCGSSTLPAKLSIWRPFRRLAARLSHLSHGLLRPLVCYIDFHYVALWSPSGLPQKLFKVLISIPQQMFHFQAMFSNRWCKAQQVGDYLSLESFASWSICSREITVFFDNGNGDKVEWGVVSTARTAIEIKIARLILQELEHKGFYSLPNGFWDGKNPIGAGDHCLWKGVPNNSKKKVTFFHGLIHGVQGEFVNISSDAIRAHHFLHKSYMQPDTFKEYWVAPGRPVDRVRKRLGNPHCRWMPVSRFGVQPCPIG